MARDYYSRTVALANASTGALTALSGVEARVYLAGTTTLATIYTTKTGSEQAANPYVTISDGFVSFWAEVGEYDIAIVDQTVPPRVAATTYYWQAISAAAGGIPSAKIASDGGLPLAAVAGDLDRQTVPLGTVLDWWRPPPGTTPVPAGFEICNGQTLTANHTTAAVAGNHQFRDASNQPITGSITLPDLRNKFIIGADILTADGTASSAGDGTAISTAQHPNAPGIRGIGGGNSAHGHNVPAHRHAISDPGHGHTFSQSAHVHNVTSNNAGGNPPWGDGGQILTGVSLGTGGSQPSFQYANNGAFNMSFNAAGNTIPASVVSGSTGITRAGGAGAVDGDVTITATTTDGRPAHVGLLKIMKCRRT